MASARVGYPGTEAALDALTTTNFDKLPGGLLAYATITANVTSVGTATADITGLSAPVTANSGRLFTVWGHATFQSGTAAATLQGLIREGSTTLGEFGDHVIGAGSTAELCDGQIIVAAPSSGSHTYKLSSVFSANANNVIAASATNPGWIGVRDEGNTF